MGCQGQEIRSFYHSPTHLTQHHRQKVLGLIAVAPHIVPQDKSAFIVNS